MANEVRLIDANALVKIAEKRCGVVNIKHIDDMPTVDAVEVVHGRWELHGNDDDCGCSYFCSNCHDSYDEEWFYVHGQYRHWNHCPNCGAKMDGDGNG